MQEIYQTNKVFTPTTPARLTFVERINIQDRLTNSLNTPGKQIVVYGHSGVGKTTLIVNKLHQIYETHITTRCMKGMSFESILLDAFSQLEATYISEKTEKSTRTISAQLSGDFINIKSQINASKQQELQHKVTPVLPPQLTPQTLGRFIGEVNGCWVLEDFHKVDDSEKQKISQIMKVFMDLSDEYETLKIIAIGAVNTARQVIEYDEEMKNRVSEIPVQLMTDSEIKKIIISGEERLNVNFPENLKEQIVKHSIGMASICHSLCLFMCTNAGITQTVSESKYVFSLRDWKRALEMLLEETSDTIKSAFEKALKKKRQNKFHHCEIIISALCDFNDSGAGRIDLLKKIQRQYKEYPASGLKAKLDALCENKNGAILRFNTSSGSYSFRDPNYLAYAQALQKGQSLEISEDNFALKLSDLFRKYFSENQIKIEFIPEG